MRSKRTLRVSVSGLLVSTLAACGGRNSSMPPPVTTAPAITTQPANASVVIGNPATFTVVASGTAPLSYQWEKNGKAVTGATTANYTVAAATLGDNGSMYDVMVNNAAGSTKSDVATLTVTTPPTAPAITTQPANASVVIGNPATFTSSPREPHLCPTSGRRTARQSPAPPLRTTPLQRRHSATTGRCMM